jgi:hypothetical protein
VNADCQIAVEHDRQIDRRARQWPGPAQRTVGIHLERMPFERRVLAHHIEAHRRFDMAQRRGIETAVETFHPAVQPHEGTFFDALDRRRDNADDPPRDRGLQHVEQLRLAEIDPGGDPLQHTLLLGNRLHPVGIAPP